MYRKSFGILSLYLIHILLYKYILHVSKYKYYLNACVHIYVYTLYTHILYTYTLYIICTYIILTVPMLYWISLKSRGCKIKHSTKTYFLLATCPFGRGTLLNFVLQQLKILVLPILIKSIKKIHLTFRFISLFIAPLGKLKLFGRYLTGILHIVFCNTLDKVCLCLLVKIFYFGVEEMNPP